MASPVRFPEKEAEDKLKAMYNPDGTLAESSKDKFWRKMREQPLVPIGSLATCGALVAASHYLRTGNRDQFQKALRWRVGLQGMTVLAAVFGTLYLGSGSPAAPTDTKDTSTLSGIATQPGRPVTVHQAARSEERREAERSQLRERLREAELKEENEQKRRAEEVLLNPGHTQRSFPKIGQDKRDRSKPAA